MMIALSPPVLYWMLKACLDKMGGTVVLTTEKDHDDMQLFVEGDEKGETVTLKLVVSLEDVQGHA